MKRLILLAWMLGAPAFAAAPEKILTTIDGWVIKRSVDQMTDKANCTAYYQGKSYYQLADEGFYIALRNTLRAITLRFDDKPAQPTRNTTLVEQSVRAVSLQGNDLKTLLQSSRLRFQILTFGNDFVEDDLNVSSAAKVFEILLGPQCSKSK